MPATLAEWLDYQQHVHKHEIEFGLERIGTVWKRMGTPRAPVVITVGGTNGKGSTVAFLQSMLTAMGQHVGCYTSPHIRVYNERICVDGTNASDASLCAAFARIEEARRDIPLTYFEYATLAALDIFARAGVDVAVLEVGLGGRLDATNMVDADVAIVTTIDLDHMQWLGPDRDSIGHEKAGIARAGRPVIVGESDPPQGLMGELQRIGAVVQRAGHDFSVRAEVGACVWRHNDGSHLRLPPLPLAAACQQANAAAAVAALHALRGRLPWMPEAMSDGLHHTYLCGRLQRLGTAPERVVDVGHNPQAARVLAQWLDAHPVAGVVHAVYGAMADKDVAGVMAAVGERVSHWHLGGLNTVVERGMPADDLVAVLQRELPEAPFDVHDHIAAAWRSAVSQSEATDRVIAFGSFYVVAQVLEVEAERLLLNA